MLIQFQHQQRLFTKKLAGIGLYETVGAAVEVREVYGVKKIGPPDPLYRPDNLLCMAPVEILERLSQL